MRQLVWVVGIIALAACSIVSPASAQGTKVKARVADLLTPSDFARLGAEQLAAAAKSPSGTASVTLATYPGHKTMLIARTKDGVAEVHANYADFLIVLEGEGTELVGGTVVDPKPQPDGETRGLRVEGATSHRLRKGDVIHIPAGIPHQTLLAPGQSMTVYAIKVATPDGHAAAK
jgi:mannose-6-phosphate isomerase-like protein (cupin superfamily)